MPEQRMVMVQYLERERLNSPTTFCFLFFVLHNILLRYVTLRYVILYNTALLCFALLNIVLLGSVLFRSIASSSPACWICMTMALPYGQVMQC